MNDTITTNYGPHEPVLWATDYLMGHKISPQHVLDVGSGAGRNSLYFAERGAQVTAIDFTPNALQALNAGAASRGVSSKIRTVQQDATDDWAVPAHTFDLIYDVTLFRHIHEHGLREAYKQNLLRALTTLGHYLIAVGVEGDGYLSGDTPPTPILHTQKQILDFFAPELTLRQHKEFTTDENGSFALILGRNWHVS